MKKFPILFAAFAICIPATAMAETGQFVCQGIRTNDKEQTRVGYSNPVQADSEDQAAMTEAYAAMLKDKGFYAADPYAPAGAPVTLAVEVKCQMFADREKADEYLLNFRGAMEKRYYRMVGLSFDWPQ